MIFLFLCFALALAGSLTVQTQYGPVQGSENAGVISWKGIPYAAPPVNDLRFQSPRPPTPWSNTKVTTSWAAGCPQNCDLPPHTCPPQTSEDCLYLNVFAPANNTGNIATMVWLHGGHFDQGAGGCDLYDATTMVQTGNVVIVTLSYRLGVLGWIATYDGLTGNYGFQDQLLAMNWVKNNIARFGGDPTQVTLFGQSAGGTSLRAHLISPYSKGLFHKAISHSDPVPLPLQDLADAQLWGLNYLKEVGCQQGGSACLKNASLDKILAAQKVAEKFLNLARPLELFLPFVPLVDHKFIPYHIFDALNTGRINGVPLIMGSTKQDALLFVYKAVKSKLNTAEYVAVAAAIFLGQAPGVLEHYPPALIGDKRPELAILGTDYIFTCPVRAMMRGFQNATKSSFPLYLYQWDHALSWDGWGPEYPFCQNEICHGADLPYLWNPPIIKNYVNFTAAEVVLSDQMIKYWTNFAKTGNPNQGIPLPVNWPAWNPQTLANLDLQTPRITVNSKLMAPQCDWWDTLGYHWGW